MAKKVTRATRKEVPTLVKAISILYYIGAAFAAIAGIYILFGAGSLTADMLLFGAFGGLFIIAGIILIALGVLAFFIAKGLWNGKSWARIAAIVLSIIGVVGAISNPGWFSLILNLLVGGYLLLSKDVKATFA